MAAPVALRHHDEEYAGKHVPVVLHEGRVAEFPQEGKAEEKKRYLRRGKKKARQGGLSRSRRVERGGRVSRKGMSLMTAVLRSVRLADTVETVFPSCMRGLFFCFFMSAFDHG